jgi:hypothetical protein
MTVALVTLSGILLAAGVSCLVVAFGRFVPRLDAALERIGTDVADRVPMRDIGPVSGRSERLGAFVYRAPYRSLSRLDSIARCGSRTSRSLSSMPTRLSWRSSVGCFQGSLVADSSI